jgi:VWFA-related protein
MMVISFDNEVRQLTEFTGDIKEIESAIKGTQSGFGKLLYEAVARALEQLKGVEGRRAVVLFGDGIDMRSIDATAESTTRLAEELGAVIYSVRFNTRWWVEAEARRHKSQQPQSNLPFSIDGRIPLPPEYGGPDPNGKGESKRPGPRIEVGAPSRPPTTVIDGISGRRESTVKPPPPDEITVNLNNLYGEADTYLQGLALRTGGQVFDVDTFSDTQAAFSTIADELRNQYLIGYYAANERRDGKYRKIKVQVARKEVQVRARTGYRPAGD